MPFASAFVVALLIKTCCSAADRATPPRVARKLYEPIAGDPSNAPGVALNAATAGVPGLASGSVVLKIGCGKNADKLKLSKSPVGTV